jgi:hypothetical protein
MTVRDQMMWLLLLPLDNARNSIEEKKTDESLHKRVDFMKR